MAGHNRKQGASTLLLALLPLGLAATTLAGQIAGNLLEIKLLLLSLRELIDPHPLLGRSFCLLCELLSVLAKANRRSSLGKGTTLLHETNNSHDDDKAKETNHLNGQVRQWICSISNCRWVCRRNLPLPKGRSDRIVRVLQH